ncbi:MAG TPA: hypothetical protein VFW88_00665, partial [Burkholderiales bacterium]|nr:hypothetical protein [Burkholderiales bacterium]
MAHITSSDRKARATCCTTFLFENRLRARRRRETQISSCNDRVAAPVQRKQLALARLGTPVNFFGIADHSQLCITLTQHIGKCRIVSEVAQFFGIGLEVEELRLIGNVMNVLEFSVADHEG